MEQRNARLRWLTLWVLAAVWMVAILARLTYLQLFQYSDYLTRALRQQQRVFEITPLRGTIYDRKGHELAVDLPMDSVFADPAEITDDSMVAHLLAGPLDDSADDIENKIQAAHTPVRLGRKLSPETVQRISDMNLKGVFFEKENRRVYPQHELAAQVIGFVDVDEKGVGGIEHSLDGTIRGKNGKMVVMADGRRHQYDRSESAPDPGGSVTLTLDETIQYIAEKELAAGVQETHAKHGTVVVQDPNTGELLAVANWPPMDANNPGDYTPDARNDRAVTAAYEPGSVFKVLTMTAAIENHLTNPDELIDCQMGSINVAGRIIHDWHPFGTLSVRDILAHSSDVGSIKVALRLGKQRFYDAVRPFGIGRLTGIDLPGENSGLFLPPSQWSGNSIGSIAIGQEVSVTPIQIISAISAVANGGTYNHPTIVKDVATTEPAPELATADPHRATDEETAATVRSMMESVVTLPYGTGKPARLDGYTAAGKSGTAQMIDPNTKRYSRNDYNASFAGFAPVNNPAVTILVVLDSPVGAHHGGEVGGPIFKRIAQQVLTYMGVPHDVTAPSTTEVAQNSHQPNGQAAQKAAQRGADDVAQASFDQAVQRQSTRGASTAMPVGPMSMVSVPNFAGQSVRSVIEQCSKQGLDPSLIGDGIAVQQYPDAGTQVASGSPVTVRFGRAAQIVPTAAHEDDN